VEDDKLVWRKACDTNTCIEVAFQKGCEAGHCLEVGDSGMLDDEILFRNNKRPDRVISCDRDEWNAFREAIISGAIVI